MTDDQLKAIVAAIFAAKSMGVAYTLYAKGRIDEEPTWDDSIAEGVILADKLLKALDRKEERR